MSTERKKFPNLQAIGLTVFMAISISSCEANQPTLQTPEQRLDTVQSQNLENLKGQIKKLNISNEAKKHLSDGVSTFNSNSKPWEVSKIESSEDGHWVKIILRRLGSAEDPLLDKSKVDILTEFERKNVRKSLEDSGITSELTLSSVGYQERLLKIKDSEK